DIDALFLQIDNLRNIIRRNIWAISPPA
ncbi:hypothetical protein ACHWGW_29495, partial [Klebsiella pneumoniae]